MDGGETVQMFRKRVLPQIDRGDLSWPEQSGDIATRLALIFFTYMRAARAGRRWGRIARRGSGAQYLIYGLGPSVVHRTHHATWENLLLPVDDPWWSTHFPPNGWGCKCRTHQITRRERERLLASAPGKYLTEAPEIVCRDWIDPRTGDARNVPVGIDPGWDYNPGYFDRLAEHTREIIEATNPAIEDTHPSLDFMDILARHMAREAWQSSPSHSP